jgi:hypothetical protein
MPRHWPAIAVSICCVVGASGLPLKSVGAADTWTYDWSRRTDRDGKPAGIYRRTPFPIDETTASYLVRSDEYPQGKTCFLGRRVYVDGQDGADANDGSSLPRAKRTIRAGVAAAPPGNSTVIIRGAHNGFDGKYPETGITLKSGVDDTHRFLLAGYRQERPVICGVSESENSVVAPYGVHTSFATVQRLKIQDNILNGIRTSRFASNLDIIDVWLSNNARRDPADPRTRADANLYLLGSDHCWISHCNAEHTYGHGFKVGDDARNATLEWCVAKEIGYWPGFPLKAYYGSSATALDFPNDAGDSDGDGVKDRGWNAVIRYNVVKTSLYYGVQIRRCPNFSFHHNEVADACKFDDMDMSVKGVSRMQVAVIGEETSGDFHCNLIHDPGSRDTVAVGVSGCQGGEKPAIRIRGNLIYGGTLSDDQPAYGGSVNTGVYVGYGNIGTRIDVLNNAFYANTRGNLLETHYSFGDLSFSGNVFHQAGPGSCVALTSAKTPHSYNLYYAPQGQIALLDDNHHFALDVATEVNADPQWQAVPEGDYRPGMAAPRAAAPALARGAGLAVDERRSLPVGR